MVGDDTSQGPGFGGAFDGTTVPCELEGPPEDWEMWCPQRSVWKKQISWYTGMIIHDVFSLFSAGGSGGGGRHSGFLHVDRRVWQSAQYIVVTTEPASRRPLAGWMCTYRFT